MLSAASTLEVGWIESVITSSFSLEPAMLAHGAARQHAVGDVGGDARRAVGEQRVGGVAQRAAGIDDVVVKQAVLAVDVADDVHHFGLARPLAPLVDDGELRVDALGQRARAHHAADVGRNDHDVGQLVFLP